MGRTSAWKSSKAATSPASAWSSRKTAPSCRARAGPRTASTPSRCTGTEREYRLAGPCTSRVWAAPPTPQAHSLPQLPPLPQASTEGRAPPRRPPREMDIMVALTPGGQTVARRWGRLGPGIEEGHLVCPPAGRSSKPRASLASVGPCSLASFHQLGVGGLCTHRAQPCRAPS